MSSWREQAIAGIDPGKTFTFTRTFTQKDVEDFGDLTRDYNPVHYDPPFAGQKGFDRIICHGLLVGSMVCELGGQLAWLASGMRFSFMRPVYVGDTVTCSMTIVSISEKRYAEASSRMVNQRGVEVMRCTLEGFLPEEQDAKRLSEMIAEGDPTNKLRNER